MRHKKIYHFILTNMPGSNYNTSMCSQKQKRTDRATYSQVRMPGHDKTGHQFWEAHYLSSCTGYHKLPCKSIQKEHQNSFNDLALLRPTLTPSASTIYGNRMARSRLYLFEPVIYRFDIGESRIKNRIPIHSETLWPQNRQVLI